MMLFLVLAVSQVKSNLFILHISFEKRKISVLQAWMYDKIACRITKQVRCDENIKNMIKDIQDEEVLLLSLLIKEIIRILTHTS